MKRLCALFVLTFPVYLTAQTFTYTNTLAEENTIPLGYEVPVPVDSLTPVDGFRTYASLHARHQQLSAMSTNVTQVEMGATTQGNTIWAYVFGDQDQMQINGSSEGAVLVNGTIHAREWQSPEGVTALMEWLSANEDDQHLGSYLKDNLNIVILPVMNIDGFLQTQRFPTLVTDDPQSPRDGRMRRKNMLDTDESLDTPNDNLNGVDLNRNNSPFWASNPNRSSSSPTSIVHHGAGPGSEPETQALYAAAELANTDRLRFYTDVHSFSQIYFAPFTGNARRDLITTDIAGVMRAANNYRYEYGPSAAGGGIGSTDEYFANTFEIPSYTLEIEPIRSATQYGGFGVSHDGFILPESEVARMREEVARSFVAGFYAIAEPPYVKAIRIQETETAQVVTDLQWTLQDGTRMLQEVVNSPLLAGTSYQLSVVFNKPMRAVSDGEVSGFADLSSAGGVTLSLEGVQGSDVRLWELDQSSGEWLMGEGISRYQTDTYAISFQLSDDFLWDDLDRLTLITQTRDMAGLGLDSNPASLVDWSNGAWVGYEDTQGNDNTDTGGTGLAMRLIDDGSSLFAPVPQQPNTPTTPAPPAQDASSGGGTVSWMWILGLFGGVGWRIAASRKSDRT